MGKLRPPSPEALHSQALLGSTAEAAFASNASGKITVWNKAAETLLGQEATQVLGKRCFEVIRGRDLFGNRFCNESCAVRKMRRHREPIHAFRFLVATGADVMKEVRCSVVIDPGRRGRGYTIIHMIQPVPDEAGLDVLGGSQDPPVPGSSRSNDSAATSLNPALVLTAREVQVLRLVASGTSTVDIAQVLGIARVTVSNHIQHILDKLDVCSKLEAVYVAHRDHLI